jgi:hypothetical protein
MLVSALNLDRCKDILVSASSAGLTVVFLVQPTIIELIAWPFMAMQILCLACAAISVAFLIRFAQTESTKSYIGFLGSSYLSMHFFGVGIAFAACAIVIGVWISAVGRIGGKRTALASWIFGVLIVAHTMMMRTGFIVPPEGAVPFELHRSVMHFGWLVPNMLLQGIRSLLFPADFPWPGLRSIGHDAVYGLGIVAAMAVLAWFSLGKLGSTVPQTRARAAVHLYAFGSTCCLALLIVYRMKSEPNNLLINYTVGPRYQIFAAFATFLFVTSTLMCLRLHSLLAASAVSITLSVTSVGGSIAYFQTLAPTIWPHFSVSHAHAWYSILSSVRNDLRVGATVNNHDLSSLFGSGVPFSVSAKELQDLLRRQVGFETPACWRWRMPTGTEEIVCSPTVPRQTGHWSRI